MKKLSIMPSKNNKVIVGFIAALLFIACKKDEYPYNGTNPCLREQVSTSNLGYCGEIKDTTIAFSIDELSYFSDGYESRFSGRVEIENTCPRFETFGEIRVKTKGLDYSKYRIFNGFAYNQKDKLLGDFSQMVYGFDEKVLALGDTAFYLIKRFTFRCKENAIAINDPNAQELIEDLWTTIRFDYENNEERSRTYINQYVDSVYLHIRYAKAEGY